MALINTTTTGVLGTTLYGDGSGNLTVQKDGVTQGIYGNIPAFSAYKSANQTLAYNSVTKVTFDTEEFDTNNNFASSTFTATIAGYYIINWSMYWAGTGGRNYFVSNQLFKNGSAYKRSAIALGALGSAAESQIQSTALVYMNGTTDYLEIYGYQVDYSASSTISITGGLTYTTFSGILSKAA